jgi:hypothetical protein
MIWLSYFAASLVYGGLGLLLGVLVTNELAGFFLIIMVSLVDAGLQNPIGNPAGNKDFLLYFPSFGPMQMAVSGGLTAARPWGMLGLALVWFVGFTLVGLAIFWWRTRAWNARGRVAAPTAAQPEPLEVGR